MKKLLRTLYVVLCLSLVLLSNARAYLDPSVMTYTVQIVAGVVVAAGALAGVLWRRAKKKVQKKMGIDENAKKESEEDVVEYDDTES